MQCNDGTGKNVVSFDFRIVEKSLNTSQAKEPELRFVVTVTTGGLVKFVPAV